MQLIDSRYLQLLVFMLISRIDSKTFGFVSIHGYRSWFINTVFGSRAGGVSNLKYCFIASDWKELDHCMYSYMYKLSDRLFFFSKNILIGVVII